MLGCCLLFAVGGRRFCCYCRRYHASGFCRCEHGWLLLFSEFSVSQRSWDSHLRVYRDCRTTQLGSPYSEHSDILLGASFNTAGSVLPCMQDTETPTTKPQGRGKSSNSILSSDICLLYVVLRMQTCCSGVCRTYKFPNFFPAMLYSQVQDFPEVFRQTRWSNVDADQSSLSGLPSDGYKSGMLIFDHIVQHW